MTDLVVLLGLPGSGKTTLAHRLTETTDVVVVSRDTIRSAMFPDCRYTAEEKVAAFAAMQEAIRITLSAGRRVCTDGMTFANEADRQAMRRVAADLGVRIHFVFCDCPLEVAQRRVATDTETVFPDRDAQAVQEVADRFAPVPPGTVRLDMTASPNDLASRLAELLEDEVEG